MVLFPLNGFLVSLGYPTEDTGLNFPERLRLLKSFLYLEKQIAVVIFGLLIAYRLLCCQ